MMIYRWDWKQQPDWDAINDTLSSYIHPYITEVETGSDIVAIVITESRVTVEYAQQLYDEYIANMTN